MTNELKGQLCATRTRLSSPGALLSIVFCLVSGATAAKAQVIYNNIQTPLPGNVLSTGFEAVGVREMGDGLIFAGTQRTVNQVNLVISSFACQQGHWGNAFGTPNACVS